MKFLNIYKDVGKAICSAFLCAGVLTASFSTYAADIQYPSQKPLSLTEGVPPNLLVTLDDSGSMYWGYAPDTIRTSGQSSVAGRSSAYNPIYYDPKTIYRVPKKISWDGSQVKVEDYPTPVFTNAKQDGFKTNPARTDLSKYFRLWWHAGFTTDCPAGVQGCVDIGGGGWWSPNIYAAPAHYFDYDKGCSTDNISTNASCYTYRKVEGTRYGIDQQKNFAIWYEFYANRNLATRSAANLAFYTMPDNVRLTWGALNSCNIGKNINKETNYINREYHDAWCYNNKIERFSGQHRVNFFKWIDTFPANGGTPLHQAMHRAGEFIKSETSDTSVCRANYHVLMTDGMWNTRGNSKGDADSTAETLPDGTAYNGNTAPYWDGQTVHSGDAQTQNTLADSAFYYWANDLRPDLANKISPYMPIKTTDPAKDYWDPRNNPATWQHMVNFTVGLGLSNSLTKSSANGTLNAPTWNGTEKSPTFANIDELKNLGTNGLSWPAVQAEAPSTIYDLWHAAINSRGEFFSADSPDSLVQAFQQILERISGRATTGSSPAINSGVGDDGTGYAYQASYAADQNWAGNLTATIKTLNPDGSVSASQLWSAKELLDAKGHTSRNIKIANGANLVDFKWTNLTVTQKKDLNRDPDRGDNVDTLGADRLSFLRGDRSKEGTTFRKRSSVLGDIVSSKPAAVRGARYLTGHANRLEGVTTKYEDFVEAQSTRTPMVYVGANDGMLHGFNADTGEETFAFVPSAVFQNLHKLTATGYGEATHQFFVDGSPVVADVFFGNKWRTVLVGTLGAGGKGMFALDVTDPNAIKLLWEFNEDKLAANGFDVKLGYTFSQPTIARLHNGKWAAVAGNGYAASGSESGKAALLIIDMETGALTKDLVVQGAAGVPNGMSTPKLADINGDGIADYAYAGDLQGNVWRFDLAPDNGDTNNPFLRTKAPRAGETVQFQVSFGGSALFSAVDGNGKRQPITAAPSIVRHPRGNGYIIVVGTGRYYAETDQNGLADSTQSIYGVWDPTTKVARSVNKAGFPFSSLTRGNLQVQTMGAGMHGVANGGDARLLTDTPVLWAEKSPTGSWTTTATPSGGALKAGWYFDLVLNKEMIVADMLQFGQTLYFQSLVPNADPCASGVENWSYAINPATGGRTSHHAWTDYRSTSDPDTVITAVKMPGEGGISIGTDSDGSSELCTGQECKKITPDPASMGRQSWRAVGGQ